MGYYFTCDICGRTEKYTIGCNCYNDLSSELNKKRIGGIIINTFISGEEFNKYIYEKLLLKNNEILCLKICISDTCNEYTEHKKIQKINVDEFDKIRNEIFEETDISPVNENDNNNNNNNVEKEIPCRIIEK